MTIFFRPFSVSFRGYAPRSYDLFLQRGSRIFPLQCSQIPQHHSFHSANKIIGMLDRLKSLSYENSPWGNITHKCLEALSGMKQLNAQETEQAIIDNQKLWVAHASIANHDQAHKHYEMFYSMQLFQEPKDFKTQQYYLNLLEKKRPEELTMRELQEIIDLYEFALTHNHSPFISISLNEKIQKYQALLPEKRKPGGILEKQEKPS